MPTVHASAALDGALAGLSEAVVDDGPLGLHGFTRILRGVLDARECAVVVGAAEAAGFERAAAYTDEHGRDVFSPGRSSMRAVVDSPSFAAALWSRIRQHAPAQLDGVGGVAVGLNERMRVLRYDPGHGFAPHRDSPYPRPDGSAVSRVTVLLYLNDRYEGGRTTFYRSVEDARRGRGLEVAPTPGAVAMQDQALLHGVPLLTRGRKYVLRTEVMYRPA